MDKGSRQVDERTLALGQRVLPDRLVRRRKVRQARRPPRQARRGAVSHARRPRQDAAQRRVPAETYGHGQHRVDVLDRRLPDAERPAHLGHVRRVGCSTLGLLEDQQPLQQDPGCKILEASVSAGAKKFKGN